MDEDEEQADIYEIVPLDLDRDFFAMSIAAFAAANAQTVADFLEAMSGAFAGQFTKNVERKDMHEETARQIESLPTTED